MCGCARARRSPRRCAGRGCDAETFKGEFQADGRVAEGMRVQCISGRIDLNTDMQSVPVPNPIDPKTRRR